MVHKALKVVNKNEIRIDQNHLKSLLHRKGAINENGDVKSLSAQNKKIVLLITQGFKTGRPEKNSA
ncbi:MAG TPA: hypothetical protein VJ974_08780 [Geopsychrobacteraceae bacterium]|nr:hypothetical protein [Geopsychrobacteraceae bacterium]